MKLFKYRVTMSCGSFVPAEMDIIALSPESAEGKARHQINHATFQGEKMKAGKCYSIECLGPHYDKWNPAPVIERGA